MKDTKLIAVFVVIGLGLAYFVGAPLRKDSSQEPMVGTPLDSGQLYVEGTLNVAEDLKVNDYAALFIIVRAAGSQGAPIAVRRYTSLEFPMNFKLTEKDNMAGQGFYEGDITVIARLDKDGAGGAAHPDDKIISTDIKSGQERKVSLTIK